jgi:hypothetical protein
LRLLGGLLVDDRFELAHQLFHTKGSSVGITAGLVGQPVERRQLLAGVVNGAGPGRPLAVLLAIGQPFGFACVELLEELVLEALDGRVAGACQFEPACLAVEKAGPPA